MELKNKAIQTIRMLSVDMIEKAQSGHPGLPLGFAPALFTLYDEFLKQDPKNPNWMNRDRFVLSAGHGSALLYSLLYLFDNGLTLEDLKDFRQLGSKTEGHPEYWNSPGVEATTGPLGQGFAMSVGMAMAERHLAAKYNKEDLPLIDHYTYVMVGDGCLQEGISQEAASLAGSLKLEKLICLYDSNNITIEGDTDGVFAEDTRLRFEALGWDTFFVEDGNDLKAIEKAISEAKKTDKPSFIEIKTKIGYGSVKEGSAASHGAPIGEENIPSLRKNLDWAYEEAFTVPDNVKERMAEKVESLGSFYKDWLKIEKKYKEKYPEDYENLQKALKKEMPEDLFTEEFFTFDKTKASRVYSGEILNKISEKLDYLVGGSADLAPSNMTHLENEAIFNEDPAGRNIQFGVREHAMAAITNGLSLHGGVLPYNATFFVFSDYLKPALRLSSMMNQQVFYILTHDSIGVGEDGPTHQPIEQLAMLRSTPGLTTFRPADGRETAAAYKYALEHKNGPTAFVLSRQGLPNLEETSKDLSKGAYILKEFGEELELILISTGSELSLTLEVAEKIYEEKEIGIRVVSMPGMDLFLAQEAEYQEEILPKDIRQRVSVEALSTFGWSEIVGLDGLAIGMTTFGSSGPGDDVFEHFGFTVDQITEKINSYLE